MSQLTTPVSKPKEQYAPNPMCRRKTVENNSDTLLVADDRLTQGYSVDLNGDNKFDPEKDALVGWDANGDGELDAKEIAHSRDAMTAIGGETDLNGDGCVSTEERLMSMYYRDKYDPNGDGKVTDEELAATGGGLWQRDCSGDYSKLNTNFAYPNLSIDAERNTTSFDRPQLGHWQPGPPIGPLPPRPIPWPQPPIGGDGRLPFPIPGPINPIPRFPSSGGVSSGNSLDVTG